MQRTSLGLLQIFQDDGGFEDGVIADDKHRRLAERRNLQKPVRLVGKIDVDPLERNALLCQRDHRALHIGTEIVADEFKRRHGISRQLHAFASKIDATACTVKAARSPRRSWASAPPWWRDS